MFQLISVLFVIQIASLVIGQENNNDVGKLDEFVFVYLYLHNNNT